MLPFKLNGASSRVDASPSISLERGGYRMRAPRLIHPPPALDFNKNTQSQRVPTQNSDRMNRSLLLLLFLISFACIACFGSAYYLFTTRWERPPPTGPTLFADTQNKATAPAFDNITGPPYSSDTEVKYLAYLPHSGFHNQRIAFENALVLARLLNRTLLVPPVLLGSKPMRYLPFQTLSQHLALSSREGLKHCSGVPPYLAIPTECLHSFDFILVYWNQLFNLSSIEAHQSLLYRHDMSPAWMDNQIAKVSPNSLIIRDESPYQYRFLDADKNSSSPLHKYQQKIYISDLKKSSEILLQIGTLFGSGRLELSNPNSQSFLKDTREAMVFSHPDLIKTASAIKGRLGPSYFGVHLRVADGEFQTQSQKNVDSIWRDLLRNLGYNELEIIALAKKFYPRFAETNLINESAPLATQGYWPNILCNAGHGSSTSSCVPKNLRCRSSQHTTFHHQALNTPLFISTDIENPQTHPLLAAYRQTFPCTFFLSDFQQETFHLHKIRNSRDGVPLYYYFLPFLDAMVVANARFVVGTDGSTFSKFIEQILWPTYHGMRTPKSKPNQR